MSSLINKAVSVIGGGRTRIALVNKDKSEEVEIDLVESFESTYGFSMTNHAIEKLPEDEVTNISDHVIVNQATLGVSIVLADDILALGKSPKSKKDKLKTILKWAKSGTIINLEGYATGGNAVFAKVVNFFKKGIGNYNSNLKEPYYLGTMFDAIENLCIANNVTVKQGKELGENISVVLNLQRANIVSAKTQKSVSSKSGSAGSSHAQKTNKTPVKEETPKKEIIKSNLKKST